MCPSEMQEIAMQQTSLSEQRLLNCRIYSITTYAGLLQSSQASFGTVRRGPPQTLSK